MVRMEKWSNSSSVERLHFCGASAASVTRWLQKTEMAEGTSWLPPTQQSTGMIWQ